jgi:hypothetical protein
MAHRDPISTARIRNVEVPMIGHADIKSIPTVEGEITGLDFGRALEAMNDRRLTPPEKVHLYEGEAHLLGAVAPDGTVILHCKNLRRETAAIARAFHIPPGRAGRLLYRELLDGFTPDRLYRFSPDPAKIKTLQEETNRNARRSEVLPLLAFPPSLLSYRPQHREMMPKPQQTALTLW